MTRREALAEARKRWGKDAYARYERDSRNFWVGAGGGIFHLCAYGPSWETALDNADRRSLSLSETR